MPCHSPRHVPPQLLLPSRGQSAVEFLLEGSRVLECPKTAPSTARPLSRGPRALIGLPFRYGRALATGTEWAGLCCIHHYHGVSGAGGWRALANLVRRGRVYDQNHSFIRGLHAFGSKTQTGRLFTIQGLSLPMLEALAAVFNATTIPFLCGGAALAYAFPPLSLPSTAPSMMVGRVFLVLTGACQFGHGVGGFTTNSIHSCPPLSFKFLS